MQKDFARVLSTGCKASDQRLVVFVAENDLGFSRLGVRVGKRLGGSVVRNRIKRMIRESFRRSQHEFCDSLDVICIAKRSATDSAVDYERSLRTLIETARHKKLRQKKT